MADDRHERPDIFSPLLRRLQATVRPSLAARILPYSVSLWSDLACHIRYGLSEGR